MQTYEYRAVPAPNRAGKVKGVKDPAERFAHALSELMNAMAVEGWEYWRAEALPCTERRGLTGSATVYHSLLVFRRPTADFMAAQLSAAAAAEHPEPAPPVLPAADATAPEGTVARNGESDSAPQTDEDAPAPDRAPLLTASRSATERGSIPPLTLRRTQHATQADPDADPPARGDR